MSKEGASRSPVLSLTIVDGTTLVGGQLDRTSKVLVVVRDEVSNPTHPNVVSVPTQRLPAPLYEAIVAGTEIVGDDQTGSVRYYAKKAVDDARANGHDSLVYAVEALAARKLGLADALERGKVRLRSSLCSRVDGVAVYEAAEGPPDYERISMLNVVVQVDGGTLELPLRTDSYSLMAWSNVSSFLAGVQSRDASVISPTFDPIELCVHGVCLTAASASLSRLLGSPLFDAAVLGHSVDRSR